MNGGENPIDIPGRVIVFDYGDVLSSPQSDRDRAELLEAAGAPAEPFWEAYWAHREGLDQGTISWSEYWERVGAELGMTFDATQRQRLWAADFRSWISVDSGTIAVLEDLAAGGTRLAFLSNTSADFAAAFRRAPFATFFEQMFMSAELDMVKPDPEIYRHVVRELGIEPAQMVFIDNKAENVRGAETIGAAGHVFAGAEGLRAYLTELASASLT